MSMNLLCGNGPSIEDIKNVCDALKSTRVDWVQAFTSGEDGPFARKELAQLQSIIMAFEAVIGETDSMEASATPEGKLDAAIEDIKRVAAAREAGLI
ncbi:MULTISPECIES: hypothetical protein [Agrobacterium]|uniref:hypothetical protein n=1 Tax=Agrobacterium TaxID=357 RepID=UPI0001FC5803|nr:MULTISPECIES: hypothetical protein [Agrobacterium]ADY64460.1 hypothetical protein AGROH133_06219 [Agrobacterium tumefaciens]